MIADLAYRWLRPPETGAREFMLFAFAVPFAVFGPVFAVLVATLGVWWSIHMRTGAIALAGVVGLLVSLVALPARPLELAA